MIKDRTCIEVYYSERSTRGKRLAEHLAAGAKKIGRRVHFIRDDQYTGSSWGGASTFYGLHNHLQRIYDEIIGKGGPLLFWDLGYWAREVPDRHRWYGYHRVSLNSRHPNNYFRKHHHSADRFNQLQRYGVVPHISVPRDQRGEHILVPGLSDRASDFYGLGPVGSWERRIVEEIRQYTDRPIIYRPKPGARRNPPPPIPGTIYSPSSETITDVIRKSWCVVTYHSNVAIDALLLGIPAIATNHGAAVKICATDISVVDDPPFLDEETRAHFFYDLAYTQWNPDEMSDGAFWRHALDEGLIA